MRPSLLDPLFAEASALPGVGPKTGKLFDRLLGDASHPARVLDVLLHLPISSIDRRNRPTIAQAPLGAVSTIKAQVTEHRPPRGKGPFKVLVEDGTGDLTLVFFRANAGWIEKLLPIGETRWVSGLVEIFDFYRQMVHPDRVVDEVGLAALPPVEPVYGLTEGLSSASSARRLPPRSPACPPCPNGWTRRLSAEVAGTPLPTACKSSTFPSSRRTSRRRAHFGCGSPMTNFCPTNSH